MFPNTSQCRRFASSNDNSNNNNVNSSPSATIVGLTKSLTISQFIPLVIILSVFFGCLAYFFNYVRKKIYKEKNNIDTSFDAGGKVSAGLTATTLVSQWTWAASLLQSSAVGARYGISGPFWYASGACIQFLLFSLISVQLKIRAPGAKTFLQVIRARFGSRTHLVFCVFALMTNIIVTAMLMLGGAAVLTNLVEDLSIELATIFVIVIIWIYTHIGGLGATFYVSYFNTTTIFIIIIIFLINVYHLSDNKAVGSFRNVYDRLACGLNVEGNLHNSHLTMQSQPGLIFGLINIVGNFGTVFVDQSYWQSSVAAKPKQGVWGYVCASLVWFAVPFTFASTMGLAYTALSVENGSPLLTDDSINSGLVPVIVAQKLMGFTGEYLLLVLLLMAITSTGSAEVVAVSSIIIYDLYCIHWKPFRLVLDANSCILCGMARGRAATKKDKCTCISMTFCNLCADDDQRQEQQRKNALKPDYTCTIHGSYRKYNDYLERLKDWSLLWVSLSILPLTMLLKAFNISLGWVYLFMGVLIGSAVFPISFTMFWSKLSAKGMVIGSITGTISGLVIWLLVASQIGDGLSDFFTSTGSNWAMLAGNLSSIGIGLIITVVISLIENRNLSEYARTEIWENTRDIDNPLSPWTEMYSKELKIDGARELDNRPSLEIVQFTFRHAKLIAVICAVLLTLIFVLIWPACMLSNEVLNFERFKGWIVCCELWAGLAAFFIIFVPLVTESLEIREKLGGRRKVGDLPTNRERNTSVVKRNKISVSIVNQNTNETEVVNGETSSSIANKPNFVENIPVP